MNIKAIRISVSIFTFICVGLLVLINLIPKGNFVSAPAISLLIYSPLIIVQFFILVQVWILEKNAIKGF